MRPHHKPRRTFGITFDVAIVAITGITSDKHIGIIEKIASIVNFDVARSDFTALVTHCLPQQFNQVQCSFIMVIATSRHRIDEAIAILVTYRSFLFESEVLISSKSRWQTHHARDWTGTAG